MEELEQMRAGIDATAKELRKIGKTLSADKARLIAKFLKQLTAENELVNKLIRQQII